MVEVGEIKQLHPTRLKQGGKSGTNENIWINVMTANSRPQARDEDRRTSPEDQVSQANQNIQRSSLPLINTEWRE